MISRTYRPDGPLSLGLTLGPLARGGGDPAMKIRPDGVWRATNTPLGPSTARYRKAGGEVLIDAWGDGAEWSLDSAPQLLGADDSLEGFEPQHPLVAEAHRRHPGLRMCRSAAVFEALVPTILEQKVIGKQAKRSYAQLVRRFGSPAPGPDVGLMVPPRAAHLAALPYYALHPMNVERKRADTIRVAARHASSLDKCAFLRPDQAQARLTALPGIGQWSAAEVAAVALGDPDAVSVGDFHLPNLVSFGLAGEPRGDDDRMLELLAPFAGHRSRVIRLIGLAGVAPPRFGPRLALQHIDQI